MKKISLSNSSFLNRGQITKSALLTVIFVSSSVAKAADILFDQMSNPSSTLLVSSWWAPNGYDADEYRWDNFLLPSDSSISEVWWVGGGGVLNSVTVRFYTGLAGYPDYQPTITALPESEHSADYLKGYSFSGNANQSPIPGTGLNQYHVSLASPLILPGNTVYWVKIDGATGPYPSWRIAMSTHGRDARHFHFSTGSSMFTARSGSLAFQLRGTVTAPQTLSGTVALSDFGDSAGQVVQVEVFNSGATGTPLQTHPATLSSTGAFSVTASPILVAGSYDIRVKGEHWLAKRVSGVSVTGSGATGVDATLTNGDVNGDNVIDLTDYTEIVTDFNSLIGDPNYHTWVDLNGDGVIDLTDYTVLVTNFNALGDN
ncbi:MAG: hypothetical protein K8R88_06050 [Armatimonadetes bacterium]|nr:hypothetical protein [Armatimonadota bacterium]